jgi:integrase
MIICFSAAKGVPGKVQIYRVLKEAATVIGIENFGTHSLRKTRDMDLQNIKIQ